MEFDIKKIMTVKDVEKARKYIGEPVYLFDDLREFLDDTNNQKYVCLLESVDKDFTGFPFKDSCGIGYSYIYCYEEEKQVTKYRPFTWEEAKSQIGNVIVHKERNEVRTLISCRKDRNGVFFGDLSAETLLRDWVFEEDGAPCGVEVEE